MELHFDSPKPEKYTIVLQEPLCTQCNSTYRPLWTLLTFINYPGRSPVLVLMHLQVISTSKGSISICLHYQMRETCNHFMGWYLFNHEMSAGTEVVYYIRQLTLVDNQYTSRTLSE